MNERTRRRRIAVFHLAPAAMADFVATDVTLLGERYEVRPVCYQGSAHSWPDAARILHAVARTDANLSWFGYRQAYYAVRTSKMLGKPSVVILGGFDVSADERPAGDFPDEDGSNLRYALRNASVVLAISERIASLARGYTDRSDVSIVPLGFDSVKFSPSGAKDRSILTVGYVRRANLARKGLLTFVQAAREIPHERFFLVGKILDDAGEVIRRTATSNVVLTGWLDQVELLERMRRASVYVQASTHEGFGSSLAQAMLCACVPVVTSRGAIPEVVGETGIYVEVGDAESLARGIREAIEQPELGLRARERIKGRFGLERRRRALLETMERFLR
jgi:glycosyltransferase involved in cell wall biosynthesis